MRADRMYHALRYGCNARKMGEPIEGNPYSDRLYREAWDAGWLSEDRHIRRQLSQTRNA